MSEDWSIAAALPMPARRDYPIAIVGAGSIVNDAHLPAYRKAGFHAWGEERRSLFGGEKRI